MKKNMIWALSTIGLAVLLGLSSFMVYTQKNTIKRLTTSSMGISQQSKVTDLALDLYQRSLEGNYFLQDHKTKLPDEAYFFTADNDTVMAKDLFREGKLLFRFTEHNCSECVNHEFELLKSYIARIGVENIVIITDYSQNEYIDYIEEDAPKNVLVLNDKTHFRKLPFERYNLPYFLMVNEDMALRNLMILDKAFDRFTHDYLRRYLKDNV